MNHTHTHLTHTLHSNSRVSKTNVIVKICDTNCALGDDIVFFSIREYLDVYKDQTDMTSSKLHEMIVKFNLFA